MSKYDAKIRHMKRHVYKGPRSHRGKYLNIDMRKHHALNTVVSLPATTPSTTH